MIKLVLFDRFKIVIQLHSSLCFFIPQSNRLRNKRNCHRYDAMTGFDIAQAEGREKRGPRSFAGARTFYMTVKSVRPGREYYFTRILRAFPSAVRSITRPL